MDIEWISCAICFVLGCRRDAIAIDGVVAAATGVGSVSPSRP